MDCRLLLCPCFRLIRSQNALTRAMRTAAAKRGDGGFLSLWAGRGVALARVMLAGELVRRLVEEMSEVDR